MSKIDKSKPVLVFGDIHFPFNHSRAIDFIVETYDAYGCGRIVCDGDIADFHRASRHLSEVESKSVVEEYAEYLECVKELTDIFPDGTLVLGNHDSIPQRQMQEIGLPSNLLKNNNELYGLPDGWKIEPLYHLIEFDGYDSVVLVEHGIGSGGKLGAINTAEAKRTSFVQGHIHSYAGVNYRQNHDSVIFGLNTGCLCDETSLAMKYGRYNRYKGVTGVGVVFNPEQAIFEKMPTGY